MFLLKSTIMLRRHWHFSLTVFYLRKIIRLRKNAHDWQFHSELIKFLGSEKKTSLMTIGRKLFLGSHVVWNTFRPSFVIPLCTKKKKLRIESVCHDHFSKDRKKKKWIFLVRLAITARLFVTDNFTKNENFNFLEKKKKKKNNEEILLRIERVFIKFADNHKSRHLESPSLSVQSRTHRTFDPFVLHQSIWNFLISVFFSVYT